MAIAKRKKRFHDVEIPLIGKETQLRDFEKKSLNGKFIKYDLTRHLRGKNSVLNLKIVADDEKAVAYPQSLQLLPSFLRRMVRKGTNYVEDSFSTECVDAKVRIKPFIITRRKVSRAVRKALRDKAKEELVNYCKDKSVNDLFDDILQNNLQKSLSLKLKKIYPLSLCEIRILKVEQMTEPSNSQKQSDDSSTKGDVVEKVEKGEEKKEEVKKEEEKE